MTRGRLCVWIAVGWMFLPSRGVAQERTPEQILAEVQAVGEPDFDPARKDEPGYLDDYRRKQHALYQRKAALLLEACTRFPTDPRTTEWMKRRWHLLAWNQKAEDVAGEVLADIDRVTADSENLPDGVRNEAAYWRAYFGVHRNGDDPGKMLAAVEALLAANPKDDRASHLLAEVVENPKTEVPVRLAVLRRLARDFPDSHAGKYAPGMIRRIEETGGVFLMEFVDAITGRTVSIDHLRGKVVVIDFWATTCAPCVAGVPAMKAMYAKWKDKGLEIIGVSLDESEEQGGLAALKAFVKKHEIPWPQFYQGAGYDSHFSSSWGVGSAPTFFVLDREGRLRFTPAENELESVVEKLLRQ